MAALAGIDRVATAIGAAHDVGFSAYVLRPGKIATALEHAARDGANVRVTLQQKPYGDDGTLAALNARLAAELRSAGAAVRLIGDGEPPVHLKAAVVDGVAFLDDRNWPEGSEANTIVETADPDDVAAVRSALAGTPGHDAHLETQKAAALGLEADLILRSPGDHIDCESESFSYSGVLQALGNRARHGTHVRLLVNARDLASSGRRERAALDYLARVGVEIRVSDADEKLCIAGDEAWVGSANASGGAPDTIDWGMRTAQPDLVSAFASRFASNWSAGRQYAIHMRGVAG